MRVNHRRFNIALARPGNPYFTLEVFFATFVKNPAFFQN